MFFLSILLGVCCIFAGASTSFLSTISERSVLITYTTHTPAPTVGSSSESSRRTFSVTLRFENCDGFHGADAEHLAGALISQEALLITGQISGNLCRANSIGCSESRWK